MNDLNTFHFDAEQVFVQSMLEHEIYLWLPPGCGEFVWYSSVAKQFVVWFEAGLTDFVSTVDIDIEEI